MSYLVNASNPRSLLTRAMFSYNCKHTYPSSLNDNCMAYFSRQKVKRYCIKIYFYKSIFMNLCYYYYLLLLYIYLCGHLGKIARLSGKKNHYILFFIWTSCNTTVQKHYLSACSEDKKSASMYHFGF